ncbi:MAG: peptidylprolyl isomerase [Bacteroidota bacterium]
MQTEVNASHILIKLSENANPEDTLKAFQKINEIRERAVSGEDFAELAKEFSEDPSAKTNGGNLGYFTSFQMVYPFESAAYTTAKEVK